MAHLYRCKAQYRGATCDTRRALVLPVTRYVVKPRCKRCGAELHYVDKWQMKRNKANTCKCDGAPWPHRRGSVPLCRYAEPEQREAFYRSHYVLPDGSVADIDSSIT